MNISINFTIPDPAQLLTYIAIGFVATLVIGLIARMRSGVGYLTTWLLAVLGAWFFASVLKIQVLNDVNVSNVPIIEAFIGALLFGLVSVVAFVRRRRVVVD